MGEVKAIKLHHPIKVEDGRVIDEITLPRPTVRDFRKVPADFFDEGRHNPACFLPMIASMSGIPESVLEMMDLSDYMRVSEVIGDFLAQSRQTGGTS